jgi:drug/metabolite transporter (DMT)-like permease
MLEPWIPFTIAAAFFQNLRSALQKHLKSKLTTAGASYVRFLYCWPFAILYGWGVAEVTGQAPPSPNGTFLFYCLMGGLAQILFTFFLVWLFSFRNFAVGTTFSKTETAQVALLGFVILGDSLNPAGILAIVISMIGVMTLSAANTTITAKNFLVSLAEKPTLVGIASGAFLGASVVFFRGAALSLGEGDYLMRAAFTLAVAVTMQTVMMGGYLLIREAGQMTAVLRSWKWSLPVGIAGALASIGWFTAFTLQNAAYVRALGQIELVFTFIASIVFFKEKTRPAELAGIAMIVAGILILLLFAR